MSEKWRCRLFWGNPTTTPPDGMPRIVKAVLCDRPHPIPTEIQQMVQPGTEYAPGTGWTIGWEQIAQRPIRRWSQEARARVRLNNLRRMRCSRPIDFARFRWVTRLREGLRWQMEVLHGGWWGWACRAV